MSNITDIQQLAQQIRQATEPAENDANRVGLTLEKIATELQSHSDAIVDLDDDVDKKQDALSFDVAPTKNSTKMVNSGNLYKAINRATISFISSQKTSNGLPNFDTTNHVLDLGGDPILHVNGKNYAFRTLFPNNPEYYRAIKYYDDTAASVSTAVLLVLNVTTSRIYSRNYNRALADEEIVIGGLRIFSPANPTLQFATLPFDYTIDGLRAYAPYHDNLVSLIPSSGILPNFDSQREVLDLGPDPILLVGNTSYALKNIHSGNESKYRAIPYYAGTSSASKIVFNLETKEFYSLLHEKTLASNEVLIGGVRHTYGAKHPFFSANMPFKYTVGGINPGQASARNTTTGLRFIAHRGVHINNIPENSLEAFRYAGQMGFDLAECDFEPTADGVLVLMHDATINRTMRNRSDYSVIEGEVAVHDVTFADLRANYVLASTNPKFRRRIPTLEEYFLTCKQSGVFPLPEIKQAGTTQAHVLQAFQLGCSIMGEGNFGFTSFSYALLDYARSLSAKTPLFYIGNPIVGTTNTVTGESRETPETVWHVQYNSTQLTKANVDAHHAKGMKVGVWNLSESTLNMAFDLGLDIISTDGCAPDLGTKAGFCISTENGFSAFSTNGTETEEGIVLAAGQTLQFSLPVSNCMRMYYMSVFAKGKYTLRSRTVNTEDYSLQVFQAMNPGTAISFVVTAVTETVVADILLKCCNI